MSSHVLCDNSDSQQKRNFKNKCKWEKSEKIVMNDPKYSHKLQQNTFLSVETSLAANAKHHLAAFNFHSMHTP